MDVPKNLKHEPIIAVNNYYDRDFKYPNESDAKALSIGQAQYGKKEISLKIWRHVKGKWSRQSEEMPIHRNLDLNILLLGSLLIDSTSFGTSLEEEIIDNAKVHEIKDYYNEHKEILIPRLEELKNLLDIFLKKQ